MNHPRLVLASASPRRKELLSRMGLDFEIRVSDADENIDGIPRETVKILAVRKAEAVRKTEKNAWIIAADTLVSLDDKALGKPKDEEEIYTMLRALSGRTHQVYTGVCLMDADTGEYITESVGSDVHFKDVTDEEIKDYISTNEPHDKAGAYAIQGFGGKFVKGYCGSYDNIVGFPTEIFRDMLERFGKH